MVVLLVILIIFFFPIPRELIEAVKYLYHRLQEEEESSKAIKNIQRFCEKRNKQKTRN